ncbi:sulfatase-like hydrolase/transferase [Halovenus sp. WSH3]|uniref:Sulfatase-like hydrolase/transferase n=1 Tax=Halovenus carboxidivorans TaxID=2692199 RepID=A0A6B0TCR4_9EURY|nr:sulfatase [Halovenus carboxidivorans]MXR50989.1 sulfatase-like hydrolase/transferase [Halovenus carboxidivorans]
MVSQPDIVWVTLDSVRADHVSMSGYRRDTTPNLEQIVNDDGGSYFLNCYASGNGTPVSSASILTGTQPSKHGIGSGNEVVPDALPTVPELLGETGYLTACLSRNSYVSSGTGLDRGFDRFKWISSSSFLSEIPNRTLLKWGVNLRRHSAGFTADPAKHATPFLMNDIAKRWLDEFASDDQPFFTYFHYNEPHRPYYPPLPYMEEYTAEIDATPKEAAEIAMRVHREADDIMANSCADLTEREVAALHAMYDAEIRYTDECIGRLFDYVQSMDRDVIFVVTADHGELFGEHGLLAHRVVLTDPVTHVPLIVHGFDEIGGATDDIVQHVDLMTTLVTQAGGDTDTFHGVDLRQQTREGAISQRGPEDFEVYLERNPDFDTDRYHSGLLTSYRTHEYRFQTSEDRSELLVPPDEETDVSADHPETTAEFQEMVDEWLETDGQRVESTEESQLTDNMRSQLRDLGYLE